MATKLPHILLLGPSGVGKSCVAKTLANAKGLYFLELDKYGEDVVTMLGMRSQWDAFYFHGSAEALSSEFSARASTANRQAVVASIPGGAVLPRAQIEAARRAGIAVVVLYGSADDCLRAFLDREATNGRGLTVADWQRNNAGLHEIYFEPEYAEIRVETFRHGTHRPIDSITEVVWQIALDT